MGMYKYLREAWKKPHDLPGYRELILKLRREPATVRLDGPTRLDRARSLGYKAKQGIFVVRQSVLRGGHFRPKEIMTGGRRSAHSGRMQVQSKNYQWIAEERTAKKYPNCEVLNSYYLAQDGRHFWYEIIMVDRSSPSVLADKGLVWVSHLANRSRVFRGLTAAGKRSRGLNSKGFGAEKLRPSRRARDQAHDKMQPIHKIRHRVVNP